MTTASSNSTSVRLPVLGKTSRVKAHVQLIQRYTRRHQMQLDTQAPVNYGINDMSSDRMQEEEVFFIINNYWSQSSP